MTDQPGYNIPMPRRFQFSLRAVVVVTAMVAVMAALFGWWSHKARQQRATLAWIQSVEGLWSYDLEPPVWPSWLMEALGHDYFVDVLYVELFDGRVTDADLERFRGWSWLKGLALSGTQVTDAGVERLQKTIPQCKITIVPPPPPDPPPVPWMHEPIER